MQIDRFAKLRPTDTLVYDEKRNLKIKDFGRKFAEKFVINVPCITTKAQKDPPLSDICETILGTLKAQQFEQKDCPGLIKLRAYFVSKKSEDLKVNAARYEIICRIEAILKKHSLLLSLPGELLTHIASFDTSVYATMRQLSSTCRKEVTILTHLDSRLMTDCLSGHCHSIAKLLKLIHSAFITHNESREAGMLLEHFLKHASDKVKNEFVRQALRTNAMSAILPLFRQPKARPMALSLEGDLFDMPTVGRFVSVAEGLHTLRLANMRMKVGESVPLISLDRCTDLVSLDVSQVKRLDCSHIMSVLQCEKLTELKVSLDLGRPYTFPLPLTPEDTMLCESFQLFVTTLQTSPVLAKLKVLSLSGTPETLLPDQIPWEIMTSLKELTLSRCTVSQEVLFRLKACKLRALTLHNCIVAESLPALFQLSTLRELTLSSNDLPTASITSQLHLLPDLEKLTLDTTTQGATHFLHTVLGPILTHCPKIRDLELKRFMPIDEEALAAVLIQLKENSSLVRLAMNTPGCIDLFGVIFSHSKIRTLQLISAFIPSLNEALRQVGSRSQLEKLLLLYTWGMNSQTVNALTRSISQLSELRELDLGATVHDIDAKNLSQLQKLESLVLRCDFQHKSTLSDKGLQALSNMAHLRKLFVIGHNRISLKAAQWVLRNKTRLLQFGCTSYRSYQMQPYRARLFEHLFTWQRTPDEAEEIHERDLLRNAFTSAS